MKLSRKLWSQPSCLLPLSHHLLNIAKPINCESWQIRALLKYKTETWGQEISILHYLEYIITDRLAGIRFLPAIKWDSQIMSCQPRCLWWPDTLLGKGRAIRCDTAWHPPAFGAVPCPDELGKCDLGKVSLGWVGNCSETVIVLWFQVKIPRSLDQVFLLSTVLGGVCRDILDVGRGCAY